MGKNFEKAMFSMNKVESLMVAIENTYLDITPSKEDYEKACRAGFAFYALWDAIHELESDLDRMNEEHIAAQVKSTES